MHSRTIKLSVLMTAFNFLAIAGASLFFLSQPVQALDAKKIEWPSKWRSPLTRTVSLTTEYGAFSLGCTNANQRTTYTRYLEDGRSEHLGIDLSAAVGDSVYAIADGRILKIHNNMWGSDWKTVILIQHAASDRFGTILVTGIYGHVQRADQAGVTNPRTGRYWVTGDVVRLGEVIGKVANTKYGPHLHFGLTPRVEKGNVEWGAKNSGKDGSSPCVHNPKGTTNPLRLLTNTSHVPLPGSIVRWKNSSGPDTAWVVRQEGGRKLKRYWIRDGNTYNCIVRSGGKDWGQMPSEFLNQIEDSRNWIRCP